MNKKQVLYRVKTVAESKYCQYRHRKLIFECQMKENTNNCCKKASKPADTKRENQKLHCSELHCLKSPNKTKTPFAICKQDFLVGRDGFEPSKSWTTDLQSVPFGRSGISPYIKNGAGERNRTINLLITNQLLCLIELHQHTYMKISQ